MNTPINQYVFYAVVVTLVVSAFLYNYFLRKKDIREYDELHEQYKNELEEAERTSGELAKDISDLVNFILSYSLFRKARGKERKQEAKLEMSVWWEELPYEAQLALKKIGKEADLTPKTRSE
jgi:hypothetical protein